MKNWHCRFDRRKENSTLIHSDMNEGNVQFLSIKRLFSPCLEPYLVLKSVLTYVQRSKTFMQFTLGIVSQFSAPPTPAQRIVVVSYIYSSLLGALHTVYTEQQILIEVVEFLGTIQKTFKDPFKVENFSRGRLDLDSTPSPSSSAKNICTKRQRCTMQGGFRRHQPPCIANHCRFVHIFFAAWCTPHQCTVYTEQQILIEVVEFLATIQKTCEDTKCLRCNK